MQMELFQWTTHSYLRERERDIRILQLYTGRIYSCTIKECSENMVVNFIDF